MNFAQNAPRSLPPPAVPDDGVPLSAAVADIVEALQDSIGARLELLQTRMFDQTRSVAVQSLLWIGAIACLGAAWLACVVAFTIWVTAAAGGITAALSVAGIHAVAAVIFLIASRRSHSNDAPGLG